MLGLELKGVGVVRVMGNGHSLLELRPMYTEGLSGLQAGGHVQVLYWMHDLSHVERRSLKVHPGGDTSMPVCGVFALRSCVRPNPIGVTVVEVVEVRENGIVVQGLDANDGSPIIDIKAYGE